MLANKNQYINLLYEFLFPQNIRHFVAIKNNLKGSQFLETCEQYRNIIMHIVILAVTCNVINKLLLQYLCICMFVCSYRESAC